MYNILIIIISFFAAYGVACFISEAAKLLRGKYNYKIKITMINQNKNNAEDFENDYLKSIITDRCIREKIFGTNPDIDINIIDNNQP